MANSSSAQIASVILKLCEERGTGKTICPSEVARALTASEDVWRKLLPTVRAVAADLAREGRVEIYRKGRVIDPDLMKGVIRLGLAPRSE
ncbi:MAG: DUF3253 domain-containing protein [Pseudomonadota bacterium]